MKVQRCKLSIGVFPVSQLSCYQSINIYTLVLWHRGHALLPHFQVDNILGNFVAAANSWVYILFQCHLSNFKVRLTKLTIYLLKIIYWRFEGFRTVTEISIYRPVWNNTRSLQEYRTGSLLFFEFIRHISRSHRPEKRRFGSDLGKITRAS